METHKLVSNGLNIKENEQTYEDPVIRIVFMFYLETEWKKTWNSLQGFEGWWSPFFFQPQKNRPFNSK